MWCLYLLYCYEVCVKFFPYRSDTVVRKWYFNFPAVSLLVMCSELCLYFILVLDVCLKTTISMCYRGDGTWNHSILHHVIGLLMYFHRITELGVPFKIKHKLMQVTRHLKYQQCAETSCIHTQSSLWQLYQNVLVHQHIHDKEIYALWMRTDSTLDHLLVAECVNGPS